MKKSKNLEQFHNNISSKLLDSIWLLDTLDVLLDGEPKSCTVTNVIKQKVSSAFNDVSKCRKIISDTD